MKKSISVFKKYSDSLLDSLILSDDILTKNNEINLDVFDNKIYNIKREIIQNNLELIFKDENFSKEIPYKTISWANFYLLNKKQIQAKIKSIIIEFYGTSCCVDKTSYIYNTFFKHHFLNKEIKFEHNYYTPETLSENDWFEFVLNIMKFENSSISINEFVKSYNDIVDKNNRVVNDKSYKMNKLINFCRRFFDEKDFWFHNFITSTPEEKFPKQSILLKEREFNISILKELSKIEYSSNLELLNTLIERLNTSETSKFLIEYPHPHITNGELWEQKEIHKSGKEYFYYIDNFYTFYLLKINLLKETLFEMIKSLINSKST